RDDREVEGIAYRITGVQSARIDAGAGAGLLELPERDEAVGADDEDSGAGGESVQAVREVHAVGGGDADHGDPDQVHDPADHDAECEQVQPGDVAEERYGAARSEERRVG